MSLSSTSVIKFCPKCSSLFHYSNDSDDQLILVCKACGFTQGGEGEGGVIKVKYVQETQSNTKYYALPNDATPYDRTFKRSYNIECIKPDCSSHNPATWVEQEPVVLLSNHATENRILYMVCGVCGATWNIKQGGSERGPGEESKEIEGTGAGTGAGGM